MTLFPLRPGNGQVTHSLQPLSQLRNRHTMIINAFCLHSANFRFIYHFFPEFMIQSAMSKPSGKFMCSYICYAHERNELHLTKVMVQQSKIQFQNYLWWSCYVPGNCGRECWMDAEFHLTLSRRTVQLISVKLFINVIFEIYSHINIYTTRAFTQNC